MLRPQIYLLFALALCNTAYAQEYGEVPAIQTTEDFDIGGPVKSLYEITYAVSFQNRILLDSTVYLDTILSRSKETNTVFNTDGYLVSYEVDSFDDKGKTIVSYGVAYLYDQKRMTGILHYRNKELTDSTAITYDRRDLIKEQAVYNHKNRLQKKIQYFHRYGRIFNIKVRDEEGMLVNFIRYEYDAAGNVTEQEVKGNTMQYLHSFKYRYDTLKDGSRQVNKYDYVGKYKYRSMVRYLEDSRGNITELIVTDSNKRVTENHTMKYTPKGLLRSELVFTRYKNEYTYRYEYDESGYWKTKYVTVNDKLSSKTHRVKELYKKEGQE